jgi:uncharacterized membrane protein
VQLFLVAVLTINTIRQATKYADLIDYMTIVILVFVGVSIIVSLRIPNKQ